MIEVYGSVAISLPSIASVGFYSEGFFEAIGLEPLYNSAYTTVIPNHQIQSIFLLYLKILF
jgi:hypothetical protein